MKNIRFLILMLLFINIIAAENSIPNNKQLYISAKYQMTPPYSLAGANGEIAYINSKLIFMSLDFGIGENPKTQDSEFGWGFSLGKQIKPTDWLQIIPGGTICGWLFMIMPKYGDTVGASPAFGGPFVKVLFGKKRFYGFLFFEDIAEL